MAKILLVEDDQSLREVYGTRLLAEGYDIVSAANGQEGLIDAIRERPDLIITDVMMPNISGFDMLGILKSHPQTAMIKTIVMTALGSPEQQAQGKQLGADRYLVKSQVNLEDVIATVHEVLGDKKEISTPQITPTATAQTAPSSFPVDKPINSPSDDHKTLVVDAPADLEQQAKAENDSIGGLPPVNPFTMNQPIAPPVPSAPAVAPESADTPTPTPTPTSSTSDPFAPIPTVNAPVETSVSDSAAQFAPLPDSQTNDSKPNPFPV